MQSPNVLLQVPLGIQRKNENVVDEMIAIMEELHIYVPTSSQTKELSDDGDDDSVFVDD